MDVVGIDYPCLDYIVATERIPGTNGEADITQESWQGGGMVPTALAALGRLGAKAGMLGVVGNDVYGKYCLADLKSYGVDVSHIRIDPKGTTDFCISVAERSTSGRSFLTRWGTRRRMTGADLDPDYIASAKYLHLCMDMGPVNVAAAKTARSAGVRVAIDADHDTKDIEEHLGLIDVLIASQKYYNVRFRGGTPAGNCAELFHKGPSVVVFTLGAEGCIGMSADGFFQIPAFRVSPIVDTTGAGDVFHGAFLRAMLDGRTAVECAKFASAAAAIKCLRLGGRAGIPDIETTERFLETGELAQSDFCEREAHYRNGLQNFLEEERRREEKWQ